MAELTAANPVNSYSFGQGMLNAWTITSDTGPLLASLQMVEDSAFDIDQFVMDRFGESIGRKLAAMAITGTGSGQPLGITTALGVKGATSGSNGGYVALGTATAVKTFAGSSTELLLNVLSPATCVNMVTAIDPAYYHTQYGDCKWYMSASQAWGMRTVVDDNGRPLINLINGFTADDMSSTNYNSNSPVGQLFGFDVVIDNNIGALTSSATSGPIFGNMGHAMVNRVVNPGVRVLRLVERYAEALAVGYYGYYRCDMRSNDLRAAVTVQAAAS